jgi:PKD domain/Divergent InlB B-repeat domain
MRKPVSLFVLAGLVVSASAARAQGPEIGHQAVGCIIAGQYPKMTACFRPLGSVARGRVYFKPEAAPAWYYVEMKSDAPCYAGVLPKPTKKLIDTKVLYYVQVVDKGFAEAQTTEYGPTVVAKESDCKDKLPIAPISRTAPAGVFPSVPPGFALGSGVSPVLVAGGVAVVGGGVAIGIKGRKGTPTPTPVPPTPIPPTPTPTPSPTPTPTPSPGAGLSVTCQAQPQSGSAPLDVAFGTFPSGGTGEYEFAWDFGDGGVATRSNPNHTYTATGTFNAVVKVTSGDQQVTCARTISVGTAPPTTFALSVAKAGTGAGTVTSSPSGINCGSACTQTFALGTNVALTASPSVGSVFAGWSGSGCSGSGECPITVDAAKSVTATFNLASFALSVTKSGTGTGKVTSPAGIDCGATCSFTFPGATVVTLTATADPGMFFMGWSGSGCSGIGTCSVTMNAAKTVDAKFEPAVILTVSKETGADLGTVSSNPPGINCNNACPNQSAGFRPDQVVVLTATPDAGNAFTNWTMDCSGSVPTCSVTMTAAQFVGANFRALVLTRPGASTSGREGSTATGDIVQWTSRLEAAGARGQVAVNGQMALSATPGVVQATSALRRGENRIEAWLTQASAAGVWRFELGEVVEPGSLAVQAGDVQSVTGDSIAFRVKGSVGERFVFTFRRRGQGLEGER